MYKYNHFTAFCDGKFKYREPDATWSDSELVRAYQTGTNEAWDILYLRHWDRLHGFFYRQGIGNPEDVKDLVQETFLEAMRNINKIENPDRFRGWLYSIATGTMSRRLKKADKRREVQESLGVINNLMETEELCTFAHQEPEHKAISKEYMEIAFSLIERLPPSEKEALRLHLIGMTNTEIADKLGIKKNAVKTRVSKAKKKMRTWLENDYPEVYADLVNGGVI